MSSIQIDNNVSRGISSSLRESDLFERKRVEIEKEEGKGGGRERGGRREGNNNEQTSLPHSLNINPSTRTIITSWT